MSTTNDPSRRRFLIGCGSAVAAMAGSRLVSLSFADDAAQAASRDLLVVIFLRGGMDGLNFVAPVDDKHYIAARKLPTFVLPKTARMLPCRLRAASRRARLSHSSGCQGAERTLRFQTPCNRSRLRPGQRNAQPLRSARPHGTRRCRHEPAEPGNRLAHPASRNHRGRRAASGHHHL